MTPHTPGTQFVAAKENATEPILPDFSYAGYHYFDKPVPDIQSDIFDVTAYGCHSPTMACLISQPSQEPLPQPSKTTAASSSSPPRGEFLVNTNADNNQTIYIRNSNIILRGSGSRERRHDHPPGELHAASQSRTTVDIALYVHFSAPQHKRQIPDDHYGKCRSRNLLYHRSRRIQTLSRPMDNALYEQHHSHLGIFSRPTRQNPSGQPCWTNGIQVREKTQHSRNTGQPDSPQRTPAHRRPTTRITGPCANISTSRKSASKTSVSTARG